MNDNFPCVKCGLCCAKVGVWVEQAKKTTTLKELAAFPYKYDASGRCENLGEDNLCRVYDKRPDICNVEKIWEKQYSHLSKKEFFDLNEASCKTLIENDRRAKERARGSC